MSARLLTSAAVSARLGHREYSPLGVAGGPGRGLPGHRTEQGHPAQGPVGRDEPLVAGVAAGAIKALGVAELLGVAGLVLPWATGIAPVLTPLAAIGLAVVLVGAAATHLRFP